MTTLIDGINRIIGALKDEEKALIEIISAIESGGMNGFESVKALENDLARCKRRLAKFLKRKAELENA